MYAIIWEYHVEPARQRAFEEHYHANGLWVECFRQHPDFVRTELLKDQSDPYHHLTIDYWRSETSFDQFRQEHQVEYDAIDTVCSAFTLIENRIGGFVVSVSSGS